MKRRSFCRALSAIALAHASGATPQPTTLLRVAWVSIESGTGNSPFQDAFRAGMRALGYEEGRNLAIDAWWGGGSEEQLARQVESIVKSRPDVIVAQGGLALHPLTVANVKIPIVFGISADPVQAGLARSLARPDGNATGMTFFALDLVGKRLQLMQEALPRMKRVAALADPQHPGQQKELTAVTAAARELALDVHYYPASSEPQLVAALAQIGKTREDAILAFADGFTQSHADRIAAFSLKERIPAVDGWSSFARAGNLMIYGPVLEDCYRRLAVYVDRIHKGARPADLPIELPAKVELVINRKTARQLGITLPASLLVRANEVIE